MKFNSICFWQQSYCCCTVKDVFLDILKVYEKSFGAKSELLSLIESYLETMSKG